MQGYDVIIIGGGPAGLSAAVYSARYKLKTLIITKDIGGMAATAHKICNFPSYDEITGFQLAQLMHNQVTKLDVPIVYALVSKIKKENNGFKVITPEQEYSAKKIIYAAGTQRRKLGVPGETEFLGRGVSYCATCDGAFFRNKKVAVIGGSDAALTAALLLAEYATDVYIINRSESFSKAEPTWAELVEKNKKITPLFNEQVKAIYGKTFVESLTLTSGKTLELNGIFIEIGSTPNLSLLQPLGIIEKNGYIDTDANQETNIKGLYAAGDITKSNLKQIITAASQGAVAAFNSYIAITKGHYHD